MRRLWPWLIRTSTKVCPMDHVKYVGHGDGGQLLLQSKKGALIEVADGHIVTHDFKGFPIQSGQQFVGIFYHSGQHLWIRIQYGWGERAIQVLKTKAVPALLNWIDQANAAILSPNRQFPLT